jgi:hypothetical protein
VRVRMLLEGLPAPAGLRVQTSSAVAPVLVPFHAPAPPVPAVPPVPPVPPASVQLDPLEPAALELQLPELQAARPEAIIVEYSTRLLRGAVACSAAPLITVQH